MTTSFFRIILSTEPRLKLPRKFVSKYKQSIPSLVSVGGPHGPAFQVALFRSNGEIWLEKGFEHFMDYYSIIPGYLLVFKYDFESSIFRVTIFDESATEIDYPVTSSKGKHPQKVSNKPCCMRMETEVVSGKCNECLYDMLGEISRKRKIAQGKKLKELDDDISLQILEKNVSLDDISRKREVSKRKILEEAGDDVSIEILEEECFMNGISRKRKLENLEKITTWQKRNQALESTKLTALQRAYGFISTRRRPSFVSFAHRSYIDGALSISKRFVEQFMNMKVDDVCDVVVRVPGGKRIWTVKCSMGSSNAILRWKPFVKDNGLCEGDACVFELGDHITPSLNVTIFRSTQDQEIKVTCET